jgi:hypothetical protein
VTTAASDPSTETPKRGLVAAAVAVAAHVVVVLVTILVGQVVDPSPGGGTEDLGAVVTTFFGGEILLGLACVIASMVMFRRGLRYTGVGLMGGFVLGLILVVAFQAVVS